MDAFNSKTWIPQIKRLAEAFYANSDKNFVSYREASIDEVEAEYPERRKIIRDEIFDRIDAVERRIDRHKVLALYVQLLLERKVFTIPDIVNSDYGAPLSAKLINERFCVMLLCIVLEEWTGKPFDWSGFEEYRESFLKILYHYRTHSEFHKRNMIFTSALAHMIYFIERDFMACKK